MLRAPPLRLPDITLRSGRWFHRGNPVLGTTWFMYQEAMLIIFAVREPPHTAMIAMLFPYCNVDKTLAVEPSNEFVTCREDPCGNSLERARLSRSPSTSYLDTTRRGLPRTMPGMTIERLWP